MGTGRRVIHADYTHSLVGALVLSAVFGAAAWWRWDRRLGLLLGAVAFSHWVLDLIVHRGDMPILPWQRRKPPAAGFRTVASADCVHRVGGCIPRGRSIALWRAARSLPSESIGRVTPSLVAGALLASGAIVLILDALGI